MKITDTAGNSLANRNNVIYLELASGETRMIGRLSDESKTMMIERDRNKHLLRKANAYGFNYELIKSAQRFTSIMLKEIDGGRTVAWYNIPNTVILETGEFLWFKEQGFERQIFMTIDSIQKFKINVSF